MALYKRPTSKYWWMKFQFDGEIVQQSTKCSNKRDAVTFECMFRTQARLGQNRHQTAAEGSDLR